MLTWQTLCGEINMGGLIERYGYDGYCHAEGESLAVTGDPTFQNGSVQADVSAGVDIGTLGRSAGLAARVSPDGQDMVLACVTYLGPGDYTVDLWQKQGGQWVALASAPVSPAHGQLTLGVSGDEARVYWNGVEAINRKGLAVAAAGTVGMRGYNSPGTDVVNGGAGVSWAKFKTF